MSNNADWHRHNAAARAEDIHWLADTGESLTGAAARLGISDAALEKFCGNHQMRDELARLRANSGNDVGHVRRGSVGMVLA